MFSFKYGRMNRWGVLGGASSAALAGVAVACSGGAASHEAASQEAVATTSQAIVAKSCQALDISTVVTDPAQLGSTNFAIDTNGNVVGWGFNGPTTGGGYPLGYASANAAVTAPTPLGISNATKIAAHEQGACAITSPPGGAAGTVVCVGQTLGGASATMPGPTPGGTVAIVQESPDDGFTLTNLTGAVGIAAGISHACAWTAAGAVWCWGSDHQGQFGDGSNPLGSSVDSPSTIALPMFDATGNPLTDVVQVAAAFNTTCVLHSTGVVECTGSNSDGELGQRGGTTPGESESTVPVPIYVPPGTTFGALYGGGGLSGGTFCATTVPQGGATETYCWGNNPNGQADIADPDAVPAPVPISSDVGSFWAQGALNGCEVTDAGAALCWGENLESGELPGIGVGLNSFSKVTIPGISSAFKVTIGHADMCALATNNLWCWGDNADGELGNGTVTQSDAGALSNVRVSVQAPTCNSMQCGTTTPNACGETTTCNCGGALGTSKICSTSTGPGTCVANQGYCGAAGCSADSYCYNEGCANYCWANGNPSYSYVGAYAPGEANNPPLPAYPAAASATGISAFRGNGNGFTVNSPSSYGSAGCYGLIVAVENNVDASTNVRAAPTATLTQAECTTTRVTMSTYANESLVATQGPTVGTWVPASGGILNLPAHCSIGVTLPLPNSNFGPSSSRVVALAEQSETTNKGAVFWSETPVSVTIVDVP